LAYPWCIVVKLLDTEAGAQSRWPLEEPGFVPKIPGAALRVTVEFFAIKGP